MRRPVVQPARAASRGRAGPRKDGGMGTRDGETLIQVGELGVGRVGKGGRDSSKSREHVLGASGQWAVGTRTLLSLDLPSKAVVSNISTSHARKQS